MSSADLLIVGGAEAPRHRDLMKAFVSLAGGAHGRFAILPAATAEPMEGFARLKGWLMEAGVAEERVSLLPVSKTVPGWEGGAWSPEVLALARAADGIWILGGNQNLIMELLHDKDGGESPLLSIMRDTCLGGSSAGAAVMSDPMIGGGTSFGALSSPRAAKSGDGELSPGFFVTKGLGFFPEGIVDQHFDSRARLGRLLEILLGEDGGKRPGFGIAEATGLIYRRAGRSLKVAGAGPVCVVEPQGGRRSLVDGRLGPLPRIEGATIHLLNEGDSYDLTSGRPLFPTRRPIAAGDEALDLARPTATGILSPYGSLAGAASRLLLDNARENLLADDGSGLRYVRSYLFEEGGEGGAAWEVRLGLIEGRSALHYRDGDGSYSVDSVRVDILPVRIDIGPYR